MKRIAIFVLAACALAPAFADEATVLQNQADALNNRCRGGRGDDPATAQSCDAREVALAKLNALGWCWGTPEQFGYQKAWVRCQAIAAAPAYQQMELLDLKTDIKSMLGRKVEVSGAVQMMGEVAMLKSDPMDMTPVWLNVERLPRADRKKLLSGCAMILCGGSFAGTIRKGTFGPELVAEHAKLN